MLLKRSIPIADDDTTGTLTPKLAQLGAEALIEGLPRWVVGEITPEPQDAERATHTHMLRKEDGEIDWQRPAAVIARMVRAYNPWPGAYSHWRGKLLKILAARAVALEPDRDVPPGTVSGREEAGREVLAIVTGSGFLLVQQLQLEGKKAMSADEFLRGYPHIAGERLR